MGKWWTNHEEQFPVLACAVCVVYSVQAASSAGNTVTSLRNILDAQKVKKLIVGKLTVNLLKVIGENM